ncbi:MAG: UDP-N-acetylenolpyruvoylglucosamine reductase, partial [Marmoricola sp.]|nr:UDP-N-acetylenolpyruvoylglucosamine reductase [Marmoricola sp.]
MSVPDSTPPTTLAGLTTLRLGGPATELVEAHDEATLIEAVSSADAAGMPVLVVGGGSNLVVADEGFDGRVVVVRNGGLRTESDTCGGAYVEAGAGEPWDDLVAIA